LPHNRKPVCVPGRIFMVELLSLPLDGKAGRLELYGGASLGRGRRLANRE